MAQYFNDFTQYPLGVKLDAGGYDFALLAGDADWTFEVEENPLGASGRVLRMYRAQVVRPSAYWKWAAVPDADKGEIYLEFQVDVDAASRAGFVGVLSSLNADATAGYIGVDRGAGTPTMVPVIRVPATALGSGLVSGTTYAWEGLRKRRVLMKWETAGANVTVSYKTWWASDAEPATWLTTTRTEHPGLGAVGIYRAYADNLASLVTFIGVGTGADSAPRVPSGGTAPTGTVTIGTITPGTTSASVPYSYSGSDATGFEYRLNGGAATTIGASPATISGLTAGTPYSIEVRAINAAGAGAWSAVANFTTEAEGPGNLPPSFDGPSIAAISGTEGVALSSLDVSSRFSDAESALTFSAVGSWPDGVTVSSAGVISGTPTTAGTYSGLQVRATDAEALTADSNTFSITVAAAALPSTITVTEPLKNNTGTLLANVSGVRVAVLEAATLAGVFETSGLTTNASGLLAAITDAAITTGQQYHVAIKLADGSVGITGPITAS